MTVSLSLTPPFSLSLHYTFSSINPLRDRLSEDVTKETRGEDEEEEKLRLGSESKCLGDGREDSGKEKKRLHKKSKEDVERKSSQEGKI